MRCDEVQPLRDPYLDSELDAKTTVEISQHLRSCSACARLFAEEEGLKTILDAGLSQGYRTAALWEKIERAIVAAAPGANQPAPPPRVANPRGWQSIFSALGEQLQAGWWRSGRAWAGLAVVWAVIFALNFTARESETLLVAEQQVPSGSEVRLGLKQKQLLMTELAAAVEPTDAEERKTAPPSPRSEGRTENLNT